MVAYNEQISQRSRRPHRGLFFFMLVARSTSIVRSGLRRTFYTTMQASFYNEPGKSLSRLSPGCRSSSILTRA